MSNKVNSVIKSKDFLWSEWIESGSLNMGVKESDKDAPINETPQHSSCYVRYKIGIYPITNSKFSAFVRAENGWNSDDLWYPSGLAWRNTNKSWEQRGAPDDFPCVNVSWYAAAAFAAWVSKYFSPEKGYLVRLPSEPEWERACRGLDGRRYPWGDEFMNDYCNSLESGIDGLCGVTEFPLGVSPVGAHNMCGNAWEWCQSLSGKYPYIDDREVIDSNEKRVIRGGAYNQSAKGVTCTIRREDPPDHLGNRITFRLVCVKANRPV